MLCWRRMLTIMIRSKLTNTKVSQPKTFSRHDLLTRFSLIVTCALRVNICQKHSNRQLFKTVNVQHISLPPLWRWVKVPVSALLLYTCVFVLPWLDMCLDPCVAPGWWGGPGTLWGRSSAPWGTGTAWTLLSTTTEPFPPAAHWETLRHTQHTHGC